MLELCHGEKTSGFILTFSLSQMSRVESCMNYAMAENGDSYVNDNNLRGVL